MHITQDVLATVVHFHGLIQPHSSESIDGKSDEGANYLWVIGMNNVLLYQYATIHFNGVY